MSSIADKIKIAQDKDGMLRRALERIIQLYTDRSHFVYELLQNAEDAEATSIKFVQYPDRLEVMHDGRPFTAENLQGLCDIGKSDKVDNLNQIGEFGVGFKSVFGICDTVKLYSEPKNFRDKNITDVVPFAVEIVDFTSPTDIPHIEMESSYTTKFVFPYTVGRSFSGFKTVKELNEVLSKKLQNLGITTLLFMKKLALIEYQIRLDENIIDGQYLLEKQAINDHCSLVAALGTFDNERYKDKTEEISYLMFSRSIDKNSNRTVDIAFPVVVDKNGEYICQKPIDPYISVYFPTETESKLGFVVQGPYRTTPNRSSIPADEEDNIRLAKETSILLREAIAELIKTNKFNMSFVKALPLVESDFDNFNLFYPLYVTVKAMFTSEKVIPCKNGGYISAKFAKIARQERLANLFSDELFSILIGDGGNYKWLPTYLTETNTEYVPVYRYLTSELKINVIRPEDLRIYFTNNPRFLPMQSDDWLVELYSILENVAAAFSKTRNETNMLVADIIKTSKGEFVAAYRKTENKQYIPNVFLPSDRITNDDIKFVDAAIYERCRHFFDNILQLQKPNEYEVFIKDIQSRYTEHYVFDEKKHVEDVRNLCKYLKHDEYRDEITKILHEQFVFRCTNGRMENAFMRRVFMPMSKTSVNIEGYLRNIAKNVCFIDLEFYLNHNISHEMLCSLGIIDSLLQNEKVMSGTYSTGRPGKQPEWWTPGEFRWKLSLEYIKDAVKYISEHPTAKDSIIKSKVIFSTLLENEAKLCGVVKIGGAIPNLENETCEMIKILRGERGRDWNGKWLFTESLELVSQKAVSKHDISTSIYGKVSSESVVYELLGFRKTESDEVDDLKKQIPQKQLDAFFENELRVRYGITSADLTEHFNAPSRGYSGYSDDEEVYEFPIANVKSWDKLRKHAAEVLVFADPVRYDFKVRKIRISNKAKEARAYVMNMYKYDGLFKYACQMCHDSCSNIEAVQIFNNPTTELDAMNLCLCSNCANLYRASRNNESAMEVVRKRILSLQETDISHEDHFELEVDGQELWFTQTHIAEIQELMKLAEATEKDDEPVTIVEDAGDSAGLSVYESYKGKTIRRKGGFVGTVTNVNDGYLTVQVTEGEKAGQETRIQLEFIVKHPDIYKFD